MSCVFCRIVVGTEPSQTIHEDEHAIAFLNPRPGHQGAHPGRPKSAPPAPGEIPVETAAHVMRAAVEVSRQVAGALGAPGVNPWHAGGETAWQSVFHFHLHVVPRFEPTDLTPPWTEVESLKGLAKEIRAWR